LAGSAPSRSQTENTFRVDAALGCSAAPEVEHPDPTVAFDTFDLLQ
jgi:hypothetical protein